MSKANKGILMETMLQKAEKFGKKSPKKSAIVTLTPESLELFKAYFQRRISAKQAAHALGIRQCNFSVKTGTFMRQAFDAGIVTFKELK